jgi:hypothetical protein
MNGLNPSWTRQNSNKIYQQPGPVTAVDPSEYQAKLGAEEQE